MCEICIKNISPHCMQVSGSGSILSKCLSKKIQNRDFDFL